MKLNRIWTPEDKFLSEGEMERNEAGILDCRRFMYLFFNENDIVNYKAGIVNPGEKIIGKAIQTNMAISRGAHVNEEVLPMFRLSDDNSTYMSISVYFYDTVFDTSLNNIETAEFILNNAITNGVNNDYTAKMTFLAGSNLYSKDIRDQPEKVDYLTHQLNEGAPNIPDPRFYTMKHQEQREGEMYCITSIPNVIWHTGRELIDDNTRISIMNSNVMHTLIPEIEQKVYETRNLLRQTNYTANIIDQTQLSQLMLYQNLESMQHGFIYIYDTNMGQNIKKTGASMIPFLDKQMEPAVINSLERSLNSVKSYAKLLEPKFGSVRITYSPRYFGDKFDIYFKDYNADSQPVFQNKLGIDEGLTIKDEIAKNLLDMDDEYYDADDAYYE